MQTSADIGERIYNLAGLLFPFCRSLTGEGVRSTLTVLSDYIEANTGIPLRIFNVPSGTHVFDWTVPKEWKIRQAYIEDESGHHIIDFQNNNLHVLGYSSPVDAWVELDELKKHIFTQPDQPDVIPYVTSYYTERYGFCMSERQKAALPFGRYHMYIDSELVQGNLTYGEWILPGETDREIFSPLISATLPWQTMNAPVPPFVPNWPALFSLSPIENIRTVLYSFRKP